MENGKKKKKKLGLSEHKKQMAIITSWIFMLVVLILGILASGNNAIMIGTLAYLTLIMLVILGILDFVHKNRKPIKAKLLLPENGDKKEPEPLKSYAVEVIPGDKNVR